MQVGFVQAEGQGIVILEEPDECKHGMYLYYEYLL